MKSAKMHNSRTSRLFSQLIKPRPVSATKRVHSFALKYLELLDDPALPKDIFSRGLAYECMSFCFDSFFFEAAARGVMRHFPQEHGGSLDFEKLDSIMFIGAFIFAKWRALSYWSYDGMKPLSDSERLWFRDAFSRLAHVTEAKYSKKKTNKEVFILYQVEFEEDGKRYTYVSYIDKYEPDDFVIVPAGPENRETLARVKALKYYRHRDIAYVQKNWKHILREAKRHQQEID